MTECSFMNLVVADSNPAEVMKDDMLALVCDLDREPLGSGAEIYYAELCLGSYFRKFDFLKTANVRARAGYQEQMLFSEKLDSIQKIMYCGSDLFLWKIEDSINDKYNSIVTNKKKHFL